MNAGSPPPGQGPLQAPAQGPAEGGAPHADLDALIERRSPLSALLRDAHGPEAVPPPALDAAIRAAARRAVAAGPQAPAAATAGDSGASLRKRAWWHAARVPLAAAATVALTVSVTLLVDREQKAFETDAHVPAAASSPGTPAVVASPAPAQIAAPGAAQTRAEAQDGQAGRAIAPAPERETAAATPPATVARPLPEAQPALSSSSAPPAAPAPAPAPAPASAPAAGPPAPAAPPAPASGVVREQAAVSDAAPAARAIAPKPAAPAPVPAAGDAPGHARLAAPPPMAPERWLEQILDMRRAGRLHDASESLAAFRKAWPGHPLPPELSREP